MKKIVSALIVMTMILTSLTVPMSVSAADAAQNQTNRVLLTENFDGESNAFDANVTNVVFEDENVGEIAYNAEGQVLAVLDIEDVYGGTVSIGYDVYVLGNGNRPVVATPAKDSANSEDYDLLQVFQRQIRLEESGDSYYTAGEDRWLRIEQILNLDAGIVQTKIYSMTGELLGSGINSNGGDSISKITFKNWGKSSAFKVDSIKVEICDPAPVERNLLTENFEGESNAFDANCTNVTFDGVTGMVGSIPKKSGSTSYASSLDVEDIYGGAVKIAYDVYVLGNGTRPIVASPVSGSDYPLLHILAQKIYTSDGGTLIYTAGGAGWLHVENLLYLDKGAVWTRIYSKDGELLGEGVNNVGCESLSKITFKNWGASSALNLDNISVDVFNPTAEEGVIFTEKFEEDTNALGDSCTNVTYDGVTGKVGEIALSGTGIIDIESIYGGSILLSYDVYLKENNRLFRATSVSGGTYYILQLMKKEVRMTADGEAVYKASDDRWVHIEQLINFDNGTIKNQIYSMEGELLGEGIYEAGCDSITKLEFINKSSETVLHIDEISIETVVDRPEVKEIAAYDIFGNKIENPASAAYTIEKIEIIFDKNISSINPSDYFVMKKGETEIEYGGKLKDNIYTMTLKDTLEPGSTYTITVSENVVDTDGNAAGENYTTTLTTADSEVTASEVKINAFTRADNTIAADAGFINTTGEKLPMVFMVAFYDADGNMLGVNEPQIKDSSDAYGRLNITFADYAGEGTVAKTKLFFWDNLVGMRPYGDAEEL